MPESPININAKFPWWIQNEFYSVPKLWENNKADDVKIAVLDSGINDHVDFDLTHITGYNYFDDTPDYRNDTVGHGTHIAGIIRASGKKSYGVSPTVKLFVAKVCDQYGKPVLDAVIKALKDISDGKNGAENTDIINMSFVLGASEEEQPKIDMIISLLKELYNTSNCLLVAASGDDGMETDNVPAYMEECISVGSIDSSFVHSAFSTTSCTLDIVAPGDQIVSSNGRDQLKSISGTSQSAAFVSGICSLAVSKMKKNNSYHNSLLKRKLLQTATSTGKDPKEYGFGIIAPNLFINSISS